MKSSLLLFTLSLSIALSAQPKVGIVSDIENDSLLHASGYNVLLESVSKCFSPRTLTDSQFQDKLLQIRKLKTKLIACNIFIPGDLKLVGPQIDEASILAYAEKVFQRCQEANVKLIVWGSGSARRIPEGFDSVIAQEQFVSIARKVAAIAKKYHIILALENLNRTECNFINTLSDALEIVRKVNHPNLKLNADIYHMLKEGESPDIIIKGGKDIVHCELAEKEKRTPPGTQGDDFRPYLRALKQIHFKGYIVLECRWTNLGLEAKPAREYLEKQIEDVWGVNNP